MTAPRSPLIIPGPDGEEYRDAWAAAQFLDVSLSTLRAHQYHDGPDGSWPRPVDPDDVVLELAGLESGFAWARAIDELLNRSGGNGMACRLWRTSELLAFRAARESAAGVRRVADAATALDRECGPRTRGGGGFGDSPIRVPVEDLADEPFTDVVSVALRPGDGAPQKLTAREVLDRARRRREGS